MSISGASSLMAHHSWLITHGSSLITHHSWLMAHHSWLITHHSWLINHHSWLITHHSWLITHHSWLITHHSWLITHHLSLLFIMTPGFHQDSWLSPGSLLAPFMTPGYCFFNCKLWGTLLFYFFCYREKPRGNSDRLFVTFWQKTWGTPDRPFFTFWQKTSRNFDLLFYISLINSSFLPFQTLFFLILEPFEICLNKLNTIVVFLTLETPRNLLKYTL